MENPIVGDDFPIWMPVYGRFPSYVWLARTTRTVAHQTWSCNWHFETAPTWMIPQDVSHLLWLLRVIGACLNPEPNLWVIWTVSFYWYLRSSANLPGAVPSGLTPRHRPQTTPGPGASASAKSLDAWRWGPPPQNPKMWWPSLIIFQMNLFPDNPIILCMTFPYHWCQMRSGSWSQYEWGYDPDIHGTMGI